MSEIEDYGDSQIRTGNGKVPGWLKLVYISLPIWGLIWFYLYWNGMPGWLDRGYWFELEKAANTTFPNKNYMETQKTNPKEKI